MEKINYCYFVYSPKMGQYKIGRSAKPEERLKSLKISDSKMELLGIIPEFILSEKQLHDKFKNFRVEKERSHYFRNQNTFLRTTLVCIQPPTRGSIGSGPQMLLNASSVRSMIPTPVPKHDGMAEL